MGYVSRATRLSRNDISANDYKLGDYNKPWAVVRKKNVEKITETTDSS